MDAKEAGFKDAKEFWEGRAVLAISVEKAMEMVSEAVALERERCAKVCEDIVKKPRGWTTDYETNWDCAAAIRQTVNQPA